MSADGWLKNAKDRKRQAVQAPDMEREATAATDKGLPSQHPPILAWTLVDDGAVM